MSDDTSDELDFIQQASAFEEGGRSLRRSGRSGNPYDDDDVEGNDEKKVGSIVQYSRYGAGFKPTTSTVKSLPAGIYDIEVDQNGYFASPMPEPTGLLLELPEMRSEAVIKIVEKFWSSEKDYKEGNDFINGGAQYKAGIMIYGPPGTGKSCTIKIVSKKLVEQGGTVFFAGTNPSIVNAFLTDFGRIEKNRKCIVILEDIDSLIANYGESGYLDMLDSAKTIDNVLFIATTNYPERLDPRIYNRPGRFSHVVKVGLPGPKGREAFLKTILKKHDDVAEIVASTDKFSIDHLSALINAVYREKKDLQSEIKRLRSLFNIPKSDDKGLGIGFSGGSKVED